MAYNERKFKRNALLREQSTRHVKKGENGKKESQL